MEKRNVAIITLNYNQSKMTLECVDSILNSNYNDCKIIVVDNGSNKEELDYLLDNIDPNVVVKKIENNCGYVGGINFGLKQSQEYDPEFFMMINNDTIIDENSIGNLVEVAERHNHNAIVTGKVYHFNDPNRIQDIGGTMKIPKYLIMDYPGKNKLDEGQFEIEAERDMIDDIFWLLPKKIFDDIGYYSNHFFLYSEQGDYARRAVNAGYKLIYTPKSKLWHMGSVTTGDGNRHAPHVNYWRKKSGIIYRYKHLKNTHFWIYSLKELFRSFLKTIYVTLQGKSKLAKAYFAACRGFIDGMLWTFNKKEDKGHNPYLK